MTFPLPKGLSRHFRTPNSEGILEKNIEKWSIEKLQEMHPQIEFPEYQREPNLWSATEKQRLIDSIIRRFDIAPLYFYRHDTGSVDCVDGRQRIGTIMSFLGTNQDDGSDLRFKILNEIYDEKKPNFHSLEGKTYADIDELRSQSDDAVAKEFVESLLKYELNVVILSDSDRSEEFNLQFTRLNLGTIINSGEKLHAMVGDIRNVCFEQLGDHPFLKGIRIPTRRFAREQVAAQILAQVFSLSESRSFTRTRHIDLQRLFKLKSKLDEAQRETIERVSTLLDRLDVAFNGLNALGNRAITVSTVLLAWELGLETQEDVNQMVAFIDEFVRTLNWQVKQGLSIDPAYHYLSEFQRNITQASAESSSVTARARTLKEELDQWRQSSELKGDAEWKERHPGLDPRQESKS